MRSRLYPFAGLPLDYLIGADGPQRGEANRITETPYGQARAALGSSIAYCNLRREGGEPAAYGPDLRHDDIYHKYHEGRPDPAGPGFERNIVEQFDKARLGHTLVEEDNPNSYSLDAVLRGLDLAQQRGLGVIAKNPGLMKDGALDYVSHANLFGIIIVQKGAGTPEDMDALRRGANKPDLPAWFVSFGDGRSWAREAARDIEAAGYSNMGVTYSADREYGTSVDVLLPIGPPIP